MSKSNTRAWVQFAALIIGAIAAVSLVLERAGEGGNEDAPLNIEHRSANATEQPPPQDYPGFTVIAADEPMQGGEADSMPDAVEPEQDASQLTYMGYDCTVDCSGHRAGYNWADRRGIDDESDCQGNSNSFREGCLSYVEEQRQQDQDQSTEEQ